MLPHLRNPRRETRNKLHKLHKLHDMLMIVLCAVLSGVEDWVDTANFADGKEAWRRGFLELPNGIPSHDTLSDVLGRIDPAAFQAPPLRCGPRRRCRAWPASRPTSMARRSAAVGTGQIRRCIG